jgi:tRNA (guanine-N7-)-methyltransferase
LSNLDFKELLRFVDLVCFKYITILFPDPWPKKKHKKRRLINSNFPELINKYSNEKTKIIVSTDDEDYLNQILYVFYKSSLFRLSTDITGKNILKKFSIQPTKYYKKALLNNRKTYHLIFEKKKS